MTDPANDKAKAMCACPSRLLLLLLLLLLDCNGFGFSAQKTILAPKHVDIPASDDKSSGVCQSPTDELIAS
jgi:hypothetical protein